MDAPASRIMLMNNLPGIARAGMAAGPRPRQAGKEPRRSDYLGGSRVAPGYATSLLTWPRPRLSGPVTAPC